MYIYQIMSNSFGYIDIILLAMIAGFIILRLRSILGRKTGHEEKIYQDFTEKNYQKFKESIDRKIKNDAKLDGLDKEQFLKGAEIAYETIITSFAKGDKNKLKPLLTENMNDNFREVISKRESDGIVSELTFIGIKESQLEKYEKIKNNLFATVKFVSEIISVKKKNGEIIEGNPDRIKTVIDHWKFSKNSITKNPNWYLSEIVSK